MTNIIINAKPIRPLKGKKGQIDIIVKLVIGLVVLFRNMYVESLLEISVKLIRNAPNSLIQACFHLINVIILGL